MATTKWFRSHSHSLRMRILEVGIGSLNVSRITWLAHVLRHSGILAAIRQLQQGHGTEHPKWADVRNKWCMRHMGANFYDHFKNKDLMVLFKRLCAQNQQRKFNTLWKLLDDMTAKQIAEREARASSANTTQATQSSASG